MQKSLQASMVVGSVLLSMASSAFAAPVVPVYDEFVNNANATAGSALTPGLWTLTNNGPALFAGSSNDSNGGLYNGHAWFFKTNSAHSTYAVSTLDAERGIRTDETVNTFVGSTIGYSVTSAAVTNGHHDAQIGFRTNGTTSGGLFDGLNLRFMGSGNDLVLTVTDSTKPSTPSAPFTLVGANDADGPDIVIQDVWTNGPRTGGVGTWLLDVYVNGSAAPVYTYTIAQNRTGADYATGNKVAITGFNLGQGFGTFDNVSFAAVPEPATASLLAVAGLAALRRRR